MYRSEITIFIAENPCKFLEVALPYLTLITYFHLRGFRYAVLLAIFLAQSFQKSTFASLVTDAYAQAHKFNQIKILIGIADNAGPLKNN